MIHFSSSVFGSNVFLTYAIGREYYSQFDSAAEDAFLSKLMDVMEISKADREMALRGYSSCCTHVALFHEVNKRLPDEEDDLAWFDWSMRLTTAEARVFQSLACHIHRVLSYSGVMCEQGDGCNASFSYYNNNSGKSIAWIHANDCSERANAL